MSTKSMLQDDIYKALRKFEHSLRDYRLNLNSILVARGDERFLHHIKTRLHICLIEI